MIIEIYNLAHYYFCAYLVTFFFYISGFDIFCQPRPCDIGNDNSTFLTYPKNK